MKQGSLFSFFSKKPANPAAAATTPIATQSQTQSQSKSQPVASAPSPTANSAPDPKALWQQVSIGSRVEVYWPDDKTYYPASVTGQHSVGKSVFTLSYDDGEVERVDLSTEKFRILNESKVPASKKRRIHESDEEEEFEYMMGDSASEADDDESVYENKSEDNPEDEEEEEDWMVTDEEDGEEKPKPAKKPRFPVTKKPTVVSKPPAFNITTPIRSTTTVTTNKMTITPSPAGIMSPSPVQALTYVKGALNPAGSHLHNHLKFLQNPRDSHGRSKDDPNYDPRTLKVDYREIERMEKLTPASRQWWELKAQYFDTVLFFKTGKLCSTMYHESFFFSFWLILTHQVFSSRQVL